MNNTPIDIDRKKIEREKAFHNNRYASDSENRSATGKYYRLKKQLDEQFLRNVINKSHNGSILEIGCGPNINTPHWIETTKEAWAIDISEVAIEQGRQRLANTTSKAHLAVMNAEAMNFENNRFDVVCGKGILHHLDLKKAYSEIARVLKPDGMALFLEPLGHNPIINLYRKFTPQMRSDDEPRLLHSGLKLAGTKPIHPYTVNVKAP